MRPVHMKGARETKRQRLKREMKMQRAGLALGPGSELYQERKDKATQGVGFKAEESSSSESSGEEEVRKRAGKIG